MMRPEIEAAGFGDFSRLLKLALHLLHEVGGRWRRECFDLRDAVEREDHDEAREAEEQRELQRQRAAIAEEKLPAAREQHGELGDCGGCFRGLGPMWRIRLGLRVRRFAGFRFSAILLRHFLEMFLEAILRTFRGGRIFGGFGFSEVRPWRRDQPRCSTDRDA
jgi:hypothetical protein